MTTMKTNTSNLARNLDSIAIKVYVHGCNCGINATYIRKVKAYALKNNLEVEVINSKYHEESRQEHAVNLAIAGHDLGSYPPIVIENGKVTLLKQWIL